MDLLGLTQTKSLGGKKYIFVIVDNFSKFTWVIFLREKSKNFEFVKNIFKKLQNEKNFLF